jgi:hypothetical protein
MGQYASTELYSTSEDGEPGSIVKFKPGTKIKFEEPPDKYGKELLEQYKENKENILEIT